MAHDFNNILSVILGYGTSVLAQLPADSPLREDIEEIVKAGERAAALTRQLLAFSRKQTWQPKLLNLNDLVRNLDRMLRRLVEEDISLELSLDENLAPVLADPGLLEQAVMNLVVNACDAMPTGGRLLISTANTRLDETYAATHPEVVPGEYVVLGVSDTGHGMTPEVMAHIFEPFFTTKEKGRGTGLGLSTVYGIVKQSGGHISVYSEVGKGATFKIYLPRAEDRPAPAVFPEAAVPLAKGTGHVLVVEDDEAVRKLTSDFLSRLGYQVTAAGDGAEALAVIKEQRIEPDLVLTDVIMPIMNGKELVDHLRQRRPYLKVIYMSGYTERIIAQTMDLDSDTLLIEKPFNLNDLAAKIHQLVGTPPPEQPG